MQPAYKLTPQQKKAAGAALAALCVVFGIAIQSNNPPSSEPIPNNLRMFRSASMTRTVQSKSSSFEVRVADSVSKETSSTVRTIESSSMAKE